MNEENAVLLETHLNMKNVITNFCQENQLDQKLIGQIDQQNTQIREQSTIEKDKITETRNLIKQLKQELI